MSWSSSTSGIGVANLGHCHPVITKAAQKQCGEIVGLQYGPSAGSG